MNSANDSEWKSCIINLHIIKSTINWLNQSHSVYDLHLKSQQYTNVIAKQHKMQINYNHDSMETRLWWLFTCINDHKKLYFVWVSREITKNKEETMIRIERKIYIFKSDYCLVTILLNEKLHSKKIDAVLWLKHLQLILYSFI